MHKANLISFAWFAMLFVATQSGFSQTLGVYSNWTVDPGNGQVYMIAQTWSDYEIAYYYDAFVFIQLAVKPTPDSTYNTCETSSSSGPTAQAECLATVTEPADLLFNSFHQVTATYYYSQFVSNCMSACYNWYDAYGLTNLGVNGLEFSDNMFWYAPGSSEPVSRQAVTRGYINRRTNLRPFIPWGEETSYSSWLDGGGIFNMTLWYPLTPVPNFAGRRVTETFSNQLDGCHQQRPDGPTLPPLPSPGSTWTVKDGNKYGPDWRSNSISWEEWYAAHISTSCIDNATQSMWINYGTGWAFYESHDIGITVFPYSPTFSQVGVYRDGVFGYKYP